MVAGRNHGVCAVDAICDDGDCDDLYCHSRDFYVASLFSAGTAVKAVPLETIVVVPLYILVVVVRLYIPVVGKMKQLLRLYIQWVESC